MSDIADKIYAATGLTLNSEAAAAIGRLIQVENEKLRAKADSIYAEMLEIKATRIAELEEELSIWRSVFPDIAPERVLPDRRLLLDRIAELEAALSSIARNTCCDRCQEAALVARAALGEEK